MKRNLQPIELESVTYLECYPEGSFSLNKTLSRSTRFGAEWYALTPFETMSQGTYYGALCLDFFPDVGLKIRAISPKKIVIQLFTKKPLTILERNYLYCSLTRWLGIWEDLTPFYRLAKTVPILVRSIEQLKGMHETRCLNLFENSTFCLALQRATAGRTLKIIKSLCEFAGSRLRFDGVEVTGFPRAGVISKLTEARLRKVAPLGYRAKYLLFNAKALSRLSIDGGLLESLRSDARKSFLTRHFWGLGQYSAEILDPCGIPLDSWSIVLISHMLHINNKDTQIQNIRDWFNNQFGHWGRTAFIYLLDYVCRNN